MLPKYDMPSLIARTPFDTTRILTPEKENLLWCKPLLSWTPGFPVH
jgi:hypothetical protein